MEEERAGGLVVPVGIRLQTVVAAGEAYVDGIERGPERIEPIASIRVLVWSSLGKEPGLCETIALGVGVRAVDVGDVGHGAVVNVGVRPGAIGKVGGGIFFGGVVHVALGLGLRRAARVGPMEQGVDDGVPSAILEDVLEGLAICRVAAAAARVRVLDEIVQEGNLDRPDQLGGETNRREGHQNYNTHLNRHTSYPKLTCSATPPSTRLGCGSLWGHSCRSRNQGRLLKRNV